MRLKFSSSLDYQADAINSVVSLFTGQELAQKQFEISSKYSNNGTLFKEKGIANNLTIPDEVILKNLQSVQEKNSITPSSELSERSFSIEMETGTGKTYVYLRTIFELNKNYGFQKFIIVVPSIAIREGVLSSLSAMSEHFKNLYNNTPFSYFVYDSARLNNVKSFASDNQIKIMIINIQSFQKDSDITAITEKDLKKLNIINRENDKMDGYKPIEFIQGVSPILIIDEPQSVDNTANAKAAIARLNPLMTLRYSATHRDSKNLVYQLDPVKAYDLGLVKRIEVASVREERSFNDAYIKLLQLDNSKGIRAYVEIHKKTATGIKPHKLWIKQRDNLYQKSSNHYVYENNYVVRGIDCSPGAECIEFANGQALRLNQELGTATDEIIKAQIRTTIEQHLQRERELYHKGIKVLSLFFVDKVASYRIYNKENNTTALGKIGRWFEEEYNALISSDSDLQHLKEFKIEQLHNGYFSQDSKKTLKDTSGATKDDENTYRLIMSDKERLLDPANPLRFIFSHSALKEGWDNPNVFQVCILREVGSELTKRQQIGRGLRLPVDANGDRIHDTSINRLTVIANESYEDFANKLQEEFKSDFGIEFDKAKLHNVKNKRTITLHEKVFDSPEFIKLFDSIKQNSRYEISFKTSDLIERAAKFIKDQASFIQAPTISIDRYGIAITKHGIDKRALSNDNESLAESVKSLPDIVTYLQAQTKLVRHTICEILRKADSYQYFLRNPQAFMVLAVTEIKTAIDGLIFSDNQVHGVKYIDINTYWSREQIKKHAKAGIIRYIEPKNNEVGKGLYQIVNTNKCLFDYIEYESSTERDFVEDLDFNENVELFFKLPEYFFIPTPFGRHTPDWALVLKYGDQKYFLVRETKSTTDPNKWRVEEIQKISCGKKHFKAVKADYDVVTRLKEVFSNLSMQ